MTDQTQTATDTAAATKADPIMDTVDAAAKTFADAWQAALSDPNSTNFKVVDLAYTAPLPPVDSAEKLAKKQAESRAECLRFATGLVGKLVAEYVIDISTPYPDNAPDFEVVNYAITLVAEQLAAAFASHKFFSSGSL